MENELREWEQLIAGLRDGDEQIVSQFYNDYSRMLHRVAERHLAAGLRKRFDAEEAVHSALRTFFRRTQIGEFELIDSQRLWGLLCAITLSKVRNKTRHHLRQKRGLDREQSLDTSGRDSDAPPMQIADWKLDPAVAVEFADTFHQLISSLDEQEQEIIDLKLQDFTNEEVAQQLDCCEKTVRRTLARIRSKLQAALEFAT
jgi:RNA polymerase sigma factor (sigma-70 family)